LPSAPRIDNRTILLLALVIGAWGSNYVVMKLGVANNGPWIFNVFRFGLAAAFLAILLGFQRGWRELLPVRGERAPMVLAGVLQMWLTTSSTIWALTLIDASRTILIAYSMPIWALLFAFIISRETVTPRLAASMTLGFGGLAVLCAPWEMDWTSHAALAGSAAALVGAIAWALGSVLYRRRAWISSFESQVFLQVLTAAGIAIVCAALFERQPFTFDLSYGMIVVYNALIPTSLAFWLWARILARMPAAIAGQFVLLTPVFGIALGHIVLSEPLTAPLMLSAVMILGGALMTMVERKVTPAAG
jgi:drug/metabolite transporter (DMT)-like permease